MPKKIKVTEIIHGASVSKGYWSSFYRAYANTVTCKCGTYAENFLTTRLGYLIDYASRLELNGEVSGHERARRMRIHASKCKEMALENMLK